MWFQSNVFMSLCAFCAVAVVAQQTTPTTEAPCVNSPEADNLARRWLSIFETDSKGSGIGAAIVNVTLSPNFTNYDEGATFGDPAPLYNSSNAVYASVSGSGYSGSLVTDVRYSTLFVFSSCNVIGLRWRSSSMSANTANVTVPVGTPVTYLGTDYLQIDLATRLIYNVTSSSDLVNYYMQLGDDVIGMS